MKFAYRNMSPQTIEKTAKTTTTTKELIITPRK
jgi:hypothetical protein